MSRTDAIEVVRRLQQAGYDAYFAGGCVRDRLLEVEPADYDVATSALPTEIEGLFSNTVGVGRRFGILLVPCPNSTVEVATFRSDGPYEDGRRPESVRYTTREEDAQRRDFTINAMFEDPIDGRLIDDVGGRNDLDRKILRAVGDPTVRFAEDHLRLLRAVRFAARLKFSIDPATAAAMRDAAGHLWRVSAERIGDETVRMLCDGQARAAMELLDETGLLGQLIPEVLEMKGCSQSADHHPEGDVFEHTLRCLGHLPTGCSAELALGVLLHDIAKPRTAVARNGKHTFYGHTSVGARMAQKICHRLRRSNEVSDLVEFLVDQHLKHCAVSQMKRSTLARFLRQDGIDELARLARIDAMGSSGDLSQWEVFRDAIAAMPPEVSRPTPLLNGHDLIDEFGLQPGPQLGTILTAVEDAQLEGRIATRQDAVAFVGQHLAESR
ncbi:MAG: poly(A) polymerase [Hyphomicrobiaceae bacterium]|jgi:poly(A) polymerase